MGTLERNYFQGFLNRAIFPLFNRLRIICFFIKFLLVTVVAIFVMLYNLQALLILPFTDVTKY